MRWSGWGDPDKAEPLPDSVVGLLRDLLGVKPAERPPVSLVDIELPGPRLSAETLADIAGVVGKGAGHILTDPESRVRHTRGKSTPDLLRIRAGEVSDAPDAVVLPGSHEDVLGILRVCAAHDIAVVPFGGGTSVVGGLAPDTRRPFVALDLRRMNRLVAVDAISQTAILESGMRAPAAEWLLNEQGFTLGHFPQSYEWASIGGFAAARSSGQASAGYGRFDEMVVGLKAATPEGELDLGRAPKSAAGPDLRQLLLGSEGAFGVITSVRLRIWPVPEARLYEGWQFASFEEGTTALRLLAQNGPLPTVLRLSDEAETMIGLAKPGQLGGALESNGCLAIVGFEGTPADIATRQVSTNAVLRRTGGRLLGDEPGTAWERGRFNAPYLRDALLDVGAFVETLETATFWSGVPRLYQEVKNALTSTLTAAGTPPLVMCHISHLYPTGASLYFTVVCAQGDDPLANWQTAKHAANDAILAAGGTISHHHGVGTDHRDWFATEIGPLGVEALRAIKDRVDPAGILNPGVLLPRK